MSLRSLNGRHCTRVSPPRTASDCFPLKNSVLDDNEPCTQTIGHPRIIVWSAADRDGVDRVAKAYADLGEVASLGTRGWESWLDDFAYTMGSHRTHFQWRSFALLKSRKDLASLDSQMSPPVLANPDRCIRIGFVFSGQGAQWPGMGIQLMHYVAFREHLLSADRFLKKLGCRWSVIGKILCWVSARTDADFYQRS